MLAQSRPLRILFLLVGAALAACGSPPAGGTPAPGIQPTITVPFELPGILSISGHFDEASLAALDRGIVAFRRENPDFEVEVVRAARSAARQREVFATRLASKDSTVDVYVVDPSWLPEFAANGWLVPLDPYAASAQLDLESLAPGTLRANSVGTNLLALPWKEGQSLALSAYSPHPDRAFRLMAALFRGE